MSATEQEEKKKDKKAVQRVFREAYRRFVEARDEEDAWRAVGIMASLLAQEGRLDRSLADEVWSIVTRVTTPGISPGLRRLFAASCRVRMAELTNLVLMSAPVSWKVVPSAERKLRQPKGAEQFLTEEEEEV